MMDAYRDLEPEGSEGAGLAIWLGKRLRAGYESPEIALEEVNPLLAVAFERACSGHDLEALVGTA